MGYGPWGHKEWDRTEQLSTHIKSKQQNLKHHKYNVESLSLRKCQLGVSSHRYELMREQSSGIWLGGEP